VREAWSTAATARGAGSPVAARGARSPAAAHELEEEEGKKKKIEKLK
jgi:hypothetical protein